MLHKGSDNITLSNLQYNTSYFHATINVYTWVKAIGLSGMFTAPSLDAAVRHFGLAKSDQNATITDKTRLGTNG